MKLLGLGYVGLNAPDAPAWENFGVETLGLMPARSQPPGHEDDGTRRQEGCDMCWAGIQSQEQRAPADQMR